jgi:hypothetical protein
MREFRGFSNTQAVDLIGIPNIASSHHLVSSSSSQAIDLHDDCGPHEQTPSSLARNGCDAPADAVQLTIRRAMPGGIDSNWLIGGSHATVPNQK